MVSTKLLKQRYQRMAFNVVRDAIAFYFGITKFLEDNKDFESVKEYLMSLKLEPEEIPTAKLIQDTEFKMNARFAELKEDLEHCKATLLEDNIWLQLLDTTPENMARYLDKLTPAEIDELSIVPKWNVPDYLLGRPYINDNFVLTNERANGID